MPASVFFFFCFSPEPVFPIANPCHCFTGWESFGPFGYVVKKKKKFPLYFIPLFVGKHLKEIEGLNDKRVCIQAAVLKDCMEEQPICRGLPASGGARARECHRAGQG